jgi:DNA-binding transcriptional LysR family regulator
MDLSWDDIRLFLAVAEGGSVSAAARALRIAQPTVSRRLAILEHRVGERLFLRAATGVRLTAAGDKLLGPARKMAEWAGEVNRAAAAGDARVTGLVRVTAAPFVAAHLLAPLAGRLAQEHPGLRLEVVAATAYLDLARGEADLALRNAAAGTPELLTLHHARYANGLFASRALAASLSPLEPGPAGLGALPWIAWAPPHEDLPPNRQLRALLPELVPSFTADDFLVMVAGAQAGAGVIVLARALAAGTGLVELPAELGVHGATELYLVAARSALDAPRVRLVASAIAAALDEAAARERAG